jgi:hypothetical protein
MIAQLTQDGLGGMLILPRVKALTAHSYHQFDNYRVIASSGEGSNIHLQTASVCPAYQKPGCWHGHETRYDTEGSRWTRDIGPYITDDFGNLVPVSA